MCRPKLCIRSLFVRALKEEEGQDLIEYALLAAFLSLLVIAGAMQVGGGLDTWYNAIGAFIGGLRDTL